MPAALLLALVLLPLLPTLQSACADDQRVECTVTPGFDGHWRQYRWAPVRVQLNSLFMQEKQALVTLTRVGSQRQPKLVLQQKVMLPPPLDGVTRQVTLFFVVPPITPGEQASFVVTVIDASDGQTMLRELRMVEKKLEDGTTRQFPNWDTRVPDKKADATSNFHRSDRTLLVFSVSGDLLPGARDLKWHQRLDERTRRNRDLDEAPWDHVVMLKGEMNHLPDEWSAYDMLDAVFLANPDWTQLKERNRFDALGTWVRAGGHLILALSEKIAEVRASSLDDLAGLKLEEMTSYSGPGRLEVAAGVPMNSRVVDLGVNPTIATSNIPILKVQVLDGTRVLLRAPTNAGTQAGWPLVVQRHVGMGTVTVFLFDPTRRDLSVAAQNQRDEADSLSAFVADGLLLDSQFEARFPRGGREGSLLLANTSGYGNTGYGSYGYGRPAPRDNVRMVSPHQLMQDRATLLEKAEPVSFKLIALFLGIYVLVIGPLDYLLLGLLNMRNLTWFTFTFFAVAFFIMADQGSESIKGGEMVIRQTTVLTFGEDGKTLRGDLFAGIFPQNNGSEVIWLDRANARIARQEYGFERVQNSNNQMQMGGGSDTLEVFQPHDIEPARHFNQLYLKACQLTRWSIRPMTATWLDEPGERRMTTRPEADGRYTVTNQLGLPLDRVMALTMINKVLCVTVLVDPTPDFTPRALDDGASWKLPAIGNRADSPKYDNWLKLVGEQLISAHELEQMERPFRETDPERRKRERVVNLTSSLGNAATVPHEVGYVLISTFADRLRAFGSSKSDGYMIECGQTRSVNLDSALDRGAIVVFGWTDLRSDRAPLEPLRVESWTPLFEHRTIARVVIWPDASTED